MFYIENNIRGKRDRGDDMIAGTGIDIIEIARIKRAVQRREGFIDRFFSPQEAAYYRRRGMNISTIAGGFAAKEAVAKALGTGFKAFGWKEIEITRDPQGRPIVKLLGRAQDLCAEKGIDKILVSISHSRDYAVAQAVALGGVKHEGCNS
jgi:holo-[acyl-carrier-protein] synthase